MHVRCPHCHNPIELVDDAALSEINCPFCGSSFSLISAESTRPYHGMEQTVLGHFELVDHLGTGAFGSVWKAKDAELERIFGYYSPRPTAVINGRSDAKS